MSRDSETVSKNMRSIHSKRHIHRTSNSEKLYGTKDTDIGKNYKAIVPASPDIVLTKYKIAIFATVNFSWKGLGNLKTPS